MYVNFKGVNDEDIIGEVITSKSRLERLANNMMHIEEFAYDTETNTLRVQHEGEMELVGISITYGEQDNYYIPTGHFFDSNQLDVQTVVDIMKPIFEREDVRIIGHNLKYDIHVLANVGIEIKTEDIFDTMIARWITDENKEKGLKGMTSQIYGIAQTKFDACLATVTKEEKLEYGLKSSNKAPFHLVRIDVGAPYALADSYWTWRHYCDWQLDGVFLEEMETIFYKVQMPFLKTLYNMERRGISVNEERLAEMQIKAKKDLEELLYEIVEIAGVEFNPASSQQLGELLFNHKKVNKKGEFTGNVHILDKSFNFPIQATTAGGAPSTGESSLKAIGKMDYKRDKRKQEGVRLVRLLLKFKKLNKLKSAFIDGLIKQAYQDGKIHPSFNQVGCLTEETLVPTDKGIFPIGELANLGEDGDFIEKELNIVNRHRELEATKYVVKYEDRETVKIRTILGMEIEGTLNHPLIVNKYNSEEMTNNIGGCRLREKYLGAEEWKNLEDITTEDYIAVPINYNTFSKEYVKLDNKVIQSRNTNSKQVSIPNILDEDLAEFMGIYYADGSIHDNSGSWGIRITNGNLDVVNRVKELSKKLFKVEAKMQIEDKKNSATTYITGINLEPIKELLELKRGCTNKIIPSNILKSPRSVIVAFIRGLTLDSCIIREDKKDYLKFTFSNRISARYIQEILLNIGIVSSVRQDTHKSDNVFHVSIYNSELDKFIQEIGFIESEKIITCIRENTGNNYRIDGNTLWIKVKEISRGRADVYDFNVPKTNSFISGAFISHNTDSGRLSCSAPNLQQLPRPVEDLHEPQREWFEDDLQYEVAMNNYESEKVEYDFWKFYEIRDAFIPDTEDEVIMAFDYSNLEMRLLAHFSKDENLLETFMNDEDAHGATAVNMFALDCTAGEAKKKYPTLRQISKTINFLLMYGGGAFTLFNTLSDQEAVDEFGQLVTKEKAQEYYDKYFEAYAGVAEFISNQKKFAHRHEMVFSLIGRKGRLPDINSNDYRTVGYQERLSVNRCIQGCLDENEPILTTKGYKSIKNLIPNSDELVTAYGTTKEFNNYSTGEKDAFKITTNHGEVIATGDHRFAVYDNGEVIFIKLSELKRGDLILSKINNKGYIEDELGFNEHELIGALIGDGSYASRNAVRLVGGIDKYSYLETAKEFVESKLGYGLNISKCTGSLGECYQFTTEQKDFRQYLESLGLTKVSKDLKIIPEHYLIESLEVKCSLLKGLFNTDGGWSKDNLIFTSKVYDIAHKTHLLLNSIGITNRFKTQGDVYRVFIERESYSLFKDLIGFRVEIKMDKLNNFEDLTTLNRVPKDFAVDCFNIIYDTEYYKELSRGEKSHVSRFKGGSASLDACRNHLRKVGNKEAEDMLNLVRDMKFTIINSIEHLEKRPTMDIEIYTKDHSYVVGNLVCHNSGGDIMMMCQPKIENDKRLIEMGCTMRLQVHDELVFVCPREHVEEATEIIKQYMEHPLPKPLEIPLRVDSDYGNTYAEAK